VGPSGWVGVVLDNGPNWNMVAALVRDAYVHVASPKLRRLLEDDSLPPPRKTRKRLSQRKR
jgi:hypothetical protein